MTRKDAIEAIKCNWPDSRYTILREALDMAISALRQQEHFREVTKKVEPMTLDDAIAHLDDTLSDTGHKWSCESCRQEHVQLRAWLAELRDIQQKRNEPLTLDELREAAETGDPVWLVRANCSSWVVIEKVDDRKYIQLVDYAEFGSDEPYDFAISDYGDSFKAYRQKPEEDDHD